MFFHSLLDEMTTTILQFGEYPKNTPSLQSHENTY